MTDSNQEPNTNNQIVFVMNGMCDLSAQLKCVFMCVTLGLWNPKGCNYVESIHGNYWC